MAVTFLKHRETATIAVLPTVIRMREETSYSKESQAAVVGFLKEHKLGTPEAQKMDLDLGSLDGKFQFDWFNSDMAKLGEIVKQQTGADYFLTLEFLIPKSPSGEIAVFGIHLYVLDAKGENAFSFLLNSHHKPFTEANLMSNDSSDKGRAILVAKATSVALDALLHQIEQATK